MNKFKFIAYSFLSIISSAIAWLFYFVAHHAANFSDAWQIGADHYFKKITESA